MQRTDYERAIADPARRRDIRREELILEVTEAIVEAMEDAGVSSAELAARLDKTRGHVSQILSGRNITLGTLAEIADALGASVAVKIGSQAAAARRPRRPVGTMPGTMFVARGGVHARAGMKGGKAAAKARSSRH